MIKQARNDFLRFTVPVNCEMIKHSNILRLQFCVQIIDIFVRLLLKMNLLGFFCFKAAFVLPWKLKDSIKNTFNATFCSNTLQNIFGE